MSYLVVANHGGVMHFPMYHMRRIETKEDNGSYLYKVSVIWRFGKIISLIVVTITDEEFWVVLRTFSDRKIIKKYSRVLRFEPRAAERKAQMPPLCNASPTLPFLTKVWSNGHQVVVAIGNKKLIKALLRRLVKKAIIVDTFRRLIASVIVDNSIFPN